MCRHIHSPRRSQTRCRHSIQTQTTRLGCMRGLLSRKKKEATSACPACRQRGGWCVLTCAFASAQVAAVTYDPNSCRSNTTTFRSAFFAHEDHTCYAIASGPCKSIAGNQASRRYNIHHKVRTASLYPGLCLVQAVLGIEPLRCNTAPCYSLHLAMTPHCNAPNMTSASVQARTAIHPDCWVTVQIGCSGSRSKSAAKWCHALPVSKLLVCVCLVGVCVCVFLQVGKDSRPVMRAAQEVFLSGDAPEKVRAVVTAVLLAKR